MSLKSRRTHTILGVGGLASCLWIVASIAFILLCAGSIILMVFGLLRSSEPFQQGTLRAQNDPRVVRALGEPVRIGWLVGGSIETSGNSGEAELSVPLSGPRDKGTLYITAYQTQGEWRFVRLEVELKTSSERINLLEE